ncbi:MAG: hypothetical protein M0D57_11090 [Sphingobacteriales bacterium JAD_PAG50586_3]|nr:MAG: hypothetical protein M0D57_11090 [Sphingobacteriales bacterium JAD_PAG50586_3]
MKKLLFIPLIALAFACNNSGKPTAEEDAKANKQSDSIAKAADDFLNDTTTTATSKDTTPPKEEVKKSK